MIKELLLLLLLLLLRRVPPYMQDDLAFPATVPRMSKILRPPSLVLVVLVSV